MRTATTTKAFRRFSPEGLRHRGSYFAGAALRGLAFGSSTFGASDFVSAAGSGVPGVTTSKFQYQVRTAFARSTGFLDITNSGRESGGILRGDGAVPVVRNGLAPCCEFPATVAGDFELLLQDIDYVLRCIGHGGAQRVQPHVGQLADLAGQFLKGSRLTAQLLVPVVVGADVPVDLLA